MYYEVYVDELFFYQFLLQGSVFLMSGAVAGCRLRIWRLILASALAAFASMLPMLGVVRSGLISMIVLILPAQIGSLFILFGRQLMLHPGKTTVNFLMAQLTAGGLLAIVKKASGQNGLMTAALACTAALILCLLRKRRDNKRAQVYLVNLYRHNKMVTIPALLDTGNSLREPVYQKPVAIIEQGILEVCESDHIAYLTYSTLGCKNKEMEYLSADKAEILGNGEKIVINDCYIAIYPGKLSETGKYQMLLHPEMMKEEVL